MKALVVYYSMYGHVHRMAEAIAEGAKQVKGFEVLIRRVPETLPDLLTAHRPLPAARENACPV